MPHHTLEQAANDPTVARSKMQAIIPPWPSPMHFDAHLTNLIEVAQRPYLVIELANGQSTLCTLCLPASTSASSAWSTTTEQARRQQIGLIGAVVASNRASHPHSHLSSQTPIAPIAPIAPSTPSDEQTFDFLAYPDQSLRRAAKLDVYAPAQMTTCIPLDMPHQDMALAASQDGPHGVNATPSSPTSAPPTIGWTCSAQPNGFLAPAGLIPGITTQGHAYVRDLSQMVSLPIPHEFLQLCATLQGPSNPSERIEEPHIGAAVRALQRFMADACALRNTPSMPRADALASTSEHTERLANTYLLAASRQTSDHEGTALTMTTHAQGQ